MERQPLILTAKPDIKHQLHAVAVEQLLDNALAEVERLSERNAQCVSVLLTKALECRRAQTYGRNATIVAAVMCALAIWALVTR